MVEDSIKERVIVNSICSKFIHKYPLNNNNIQKLNDYCLNNNITITHMDPSHYTNISSDINNLYNLFKVDNDLNYVIPQELNFIRSIVGFDYNKKFNSYLKLNKEDIVPKLEPKVTINNLFTYYNIPKDFNGTGQTIGIIELGGGYNINDLNTYFTNLGLSKKPIIKSVFLDGAINDTSDYSSSIEVVLDIEIAGSIANASTIVVYFAPNTTVGFYDAIWYATHDTVNNPSVISISWGAPEPYWYPGTMQAFNNLFINAVNKGINIFVASGDAGSSDGINDGKPHVDFPASSPYVIGCGGTTITNVSNPNSEIVWKNSTGASGGGFSTIFTKPGYQLNNSSNTFRGVPDVCGNADPTTGYFIYINGQYIQVGGTSAVAPLWAGFTALLNQSNAGESIGFLNVPFYSNKYILKDVTVGNNDTVPNTVGLYNASVGWDPCTGIGSINGIAIINRLVPPSKYGQ